MVDIVLQQAVRKNEPVEIIYMDNRAGAITQRQIRIYRMTAETVKAYCYERQAVRTFRRDHILAAQRGSGGVDRGNKLWEGHRMFLPEHAALYRERKRERYTPPVLDEQRWEEIDRLVSEAMREGWTLCWTVFHPDGPYVVQGRVGRIRPEQGWIEVCGADGGIRVPLNRLVDVRPVEE